jgi:hypothetical protein
MQATRARIGHSRSPLVLPVLSRTGLHVWTFGEGLPFAAHVTNYYNLPGEQVVEIGRQTRF